MAGEVELTTRLSKPSVPVIGQAQMVYVLLEIMPTEAVAGLRMPLNFSLVLDRSGSMEGEKIGRLKEAVGWVIDQLGPGDNVSIVTFASQTTVVVPHRPVLGDDLGDEERADLRHKVDQIKAGGGTRMAPAMIAGLKEVREAAVPGCVNRMVLLTDGLTEVEQDCLKAADQAAADGIAILALGVGSDWNEDLLIEIGRRSGGQANYIAHAQDIMHHFEQAVQSMQAAVVHGAVLTLRLVAGVHPRRVWRVVPLIADLGYGPIEDRFVTLPLGELQREQGQVLLIELMIPDRAPGTYRIAQVEVAYDVPGLQVVQEKVRRDVLIDYTHDPALAAQVDPRVMNIVETVQAFKLQTRALQEAELGNLDNATRQLRAAATILLSQGEPDLARTMKLEADKLEQEGKMTSEGRKTIKIESGKTAKLG